MCVCFLDEFVHMCSHMCACVPCECVWLVCTGASPWAAGATASPWAAGPGATSCSAMAGWEEVGLGLQLPGWDRACGSLTGVGGCAGGWQGGGVRWRQRSRSWYSDRLIRRPRLGRGGSHVVWCWYMATKLSPTLIHLVSEGYKEIVSPVTI